MSEVCKICDRPEREWAEDSLDDHLSGHRPASVRAMYPDEYDRIFGDGTDAGEDRRADANRATGRDDGEDRSRDAGGSVAGVDDPYGKKWFVIGVGGAGNNIVDAILLRRETLEHNNEDRALVWQGGLAGYGILNTNIAELEGTYYAQEVKGYDRLDLLENTIIGHGKSDYAGAGHRWDIGKKLMEADVADGEPFRDRWDMSPEDVQEAQAVMFVHSVTKGTGCGATPVLARHVREDVLPEDFVVEKPLLSSVVLPSEGAEYSEFGGRAKVNGVVGLARVAQAVDAVIPFDNHRLQAAQADITPRIERIAEYNPPHYRELNKPLVAFLEAFTMSSIPQFLDRDASMSIKGDVFDPADSFRPVQDKYPAELDRRPAVVLAPVLGRSSGTSIDESSLEILVRNTLFQNKLADFDPQTAWGGTFLLYGPEGKMEQVSEYVSDGTFTDIVTGEQYLDAGTVHGAGSVDVHVKQLVSPYLDDVYLWGTLWNPKLPSLETMYEHAKRLKEEGTNEQAENLREIWEYVDPLFSVLGRENMV